MADLKKFHLINIGWDSRKSHGVDPDAEGIASLCGLRVPPHELVLSHWGCDERLESDDCQRCVRIARERR